MTLFSKLALYNTAIRLVLIGALWLVCPALSKEPGYFIVTGILFVSCLVDLGYLRFLLGPLKILVNRKLRVIPKPGEMNVVPLVTTTLELTQLDTHINDLMRRLALRFECEKAFTVYASHELLTPIAVLLTRFDNLIVDQQTPTDVATQLVESQQTLLRLSKVVQMLLRLVQIENHQYLKNDTVSIRNVIQEVLHDLDDRIALKNIQVELHMDEDILVSPANYSLMHTMLLNLIGNAVRYNAEQGRLHIVRSQVGNTPTLTIRDTGRGMTPEQIAALTEYGHPGKSSGESTGIGLQLVLTIATFHHIELGVDAALVPGTRVTLTFI